jgi:hypothetical protein
MKKKYLIILIIIIILLILTLFIKKKEVIEPFQRTKNGFTEACRELVTKRNFLRDYVRQLRTPVQDLSSTMVLAKQGKKDNMAYQRTYTDLCSKLTPVIDGINAIDASGGFLNITTQAQACRALASVDKYQLELLPDIDIFYATILLENQDKLDYALRYINFYTNMIKCPIPNESRVTFDASENIIDSSGNVVNPNTHITISRDIGSLDTRKLALELEKLSPYYLSPDVVKYIIRFMISEEKMDYLNDTSADFVDGIGNLMNEIYKRYYPSSSTTLLGTYRA